MRRISLLVLLLTAAMLVAAGCGQYGKRYEGEGASSTTAAAKEDRPITDEAFDEKVRERDGCTEIEEFESEGNEHTTDPDEEVEYEHNPPHSGNHYQIAADWGLYDTTQPDTHTVHNLEHGHILVQFKGLTAEQEEQVYEQARINPYHLLVEPRDKNPKDGVYYTAWTAQVHCEKPSAAALQEMIENYRDQGPELFTDDAGGLDEMNAN